MGKKKTGLITDEVRELINEVARATASMAYIDGMGGEVNYFRAMESLLFNYKKLAALVADYEAYTHVELQGRSASISSYSPSSGYTYRTEEDIPCHVKHDLYAAGNRPRKRNRVHREQASICKQSNEAEHFNTAFRSRVAEPKRRYGHLEHGACGGRRKILYPQGIHRSFTAWKGGEHKCR